MSSKRRLDSFYSQLVAFGRLRTFRTRIFDFEKKNAKIGKIKIKKKKIKKKAFLLIQDTDW